MLERLELKTWNGLLWLVSCQELNMKNFVTISCLYGTKMTGKISLGNLTKNSKANGYREIDFGRKRIISLSELFIINFAVVCNFRLLIYKLIVFMTRVFVGRLFCCFLWLAVVTLNSRNRTVHFGEDFDSQTWLWNVFVVVECSKDKIRKFEWSWHFSFLAIWGRQKNSDDKMSQR